MKREHYKFIRERFSHYDLVEIAARYEVGDFRWSDRVKDLQVRFCWDILHAAIPLNWLCDTLYLYLNEDHIYIALKKLCPNVTKRY